MSNNKENIQQHSSLLIPHFSLSKSRYCSGLQCPKILWLDDHKSEEKDESATNQARLTAGHRVGGLAMEYFGAFSYVPCNADKNIMIAETQKLLAEKAPVICEASFASDSGFCSVDILRCFEDGVEIVEVKSTTKLDEDKHLDDMAFQYHILTSCGLNVKKVSLLHITKKYKRIGELDLQKLFTLVDCTEKVIEKHKDIKDNIARIKIIAGAKTEPEIAPGKHCNKPFPCGYIKYCNKNIVTDKTTAENEQVIIDKEKIKEFLNTLTYPLYYFDFETFSEAVPSYDQQWTYQKVPFQYSLHIQPKPLAECEHKEFLAEFGVYPCREAAERLCADIPDNVCVLAWHMSFEKTVIKELSEMFPDLAPHLMAIHNNIKDLETPFLNKAWRSPAQMGRTSLKHVLPAMFPNDKELDYKELDLIHNGEQASAIFMGLLNHTGEEQLKIRKALLEYCKLDTYAMVKILNKLVEIANK